MRFMKGIGRGRNTTQKLENLGNVEKVGLTLEERIEKLEEIIKILSLQLKILKRDLPMIRAIGKDNGK